MFCAEQNQVSNSQLLGSHPLLEVFGPGFLGQADVIPCPGLQDPILEVLGKILYHWAGDLVVNGHRQSWVSTMIEKKWCVTQGWVH